MTQNIELSVVMPCLNEATTLPGCIADAQGFFTEQVLSAEIVVADNGSSDGSPALATAHGARVVAVPVRGYGAALAAGIAAARGRFVIMGDSDGTYDFRHLGPILERLRAGDDLVLGNRFRGGIAVGAMPWLHRYLGNPLISWLGRHLHRAPVRDFYCGLRGFHRAHILDLGLSETGMVFALEMVVRARQAGLRISEVPTTLSVAERAHPPHLQTWRDGWRSIRYLFRAALPAG